MIIVRDSLRARGILIAVAYLAIFRREVGDRSSCNVATSSHESERSVAPREEDQESSEGTSQEIHSNGHADSRGAFPPLVGVQVVPAPRPRRSGSVSGLRHFPRIIHQSWKTDDWSRLRPDHRAAALTWRRLHHAQPSPPDAGDDEWSAASSPASPGTAKGSSKEQATRFAVLDEQLRQAAHGVDAAQPRGGTNDKNARQWFHRLWSDAANDWLVKSHYPDFYDAAYKEMEPIYKIDSVRFAYMHRYGGVYADLDFFAVRDWEGVLRRHEGGGRSAPSVLLPSFFSERRLAELSSAQTDCYDEHFAYLSDRLRKNGLADKMTPKNVAQWRSQFLDNPDFSSGAKFYAKGETSSGRCVLPNVSPLPAFPEAEAELWSWGNRTCSSVERDAVRREEARRQARQKFSGEDKAWTQGTVPNALMLSKPGEDLCS